MATYKDGSVSLLHIPEGGKFTITDYSYSRRSYWNVNGRLPEPCIRGKRDEHNCTFIHCTDAAGKSYKLSIALNVLHYEE